MKWKVLGYVLEKMTAYLNNLKSIGLWGALQGGGGWGLWLQRDGRESRSVGREEVWGEREVGNEKKEGKEIRWMNKRRRKKGKKWEMKIWGKIFAGRKKIYAGRACPIEFFFFW